jgi:predicted lipoprotein with Yx(FWY)xxD motif
MKLRSILLGAFAAATLSTTAALAEDFLGGAVKTMDIGGQMVLVGAGDMTLYTFDKDEQGVASNCYDKCATNWPPLFAEASAAAEGDFTIIDRTDGTKIWAYNGWPLYYWVKDTKPGDTTGDMVGEVWHTAVHAGM